MNRRTVLATAGLAAVAGCLSAPPSSESESDPDAAEPETDGSAAPDDADPTAPTTFEATLSFPSSVLSMDERIAETARPNQVTDISGLDKPAAEAVKTAIDDGGYETEAADDTLLEGLFGLQYVKADGTVYDIEYSMPEYVVSASDVPESKVDPDRTISRRDDTLRAMGVDNREIIRAIATVLESAPGPTDEGGASGRDYRATVLDDELESFLEEYDYVVYPGDGEGEPDPEGYVELELDREDPGPPYTIAAAEISDVQRYGRPVVDVATYPEPAADALQTAAERRSLLIDERPDGIDAVLEDEAYVRVAGDVYAPALETVDRDAVPISLEVTDVDPDARSFTLEVAATDEPAVLFCGAPEPFGILRAFPMTGDGESDDDSNARPILWTDTYETNAHIHVRERDGDPMISVNDIGIQTRLEPGDTRRETYEVRAEWGFEGGHYRLEDSLSVEWGSLDGSGGGTESSTYPFVVSLAVPELES